MAISIDEEIVHYVIASSIFITIYPFIFIYTGYQNLTPLEKEEYSKTFTGLVFALPILFGVLFALGYRLLGFVPRKYNNIYIRYIVAGATTGFLVSLILHYVFHIQDRWLKMENPEASHLLAPIFYFILFYTFGVWVRAQILYGSAPPSSTSSPSLPKPPSIPISTTPVSTYDKLAQLSKK